MDKKLVLIGILLLLSVTLSACVGYVGYRHHGYGYGYSSYPHSGYYGYPDRYHHRGHDHYRHWR